MVILIVVLAVLVVAALGVGLVVARQRPDRRSLPGEPRTRPATRAPATRPVSPAPPTLDVPPGPDLDVEVVAVVDDDGDVAVVDQTGVEVAEPEPAVAEPEPAVAEPEVRPRLRDRLGRARALLGGALGGIRGRERIDDEAWDDLEEALIRADVGVATTTALLDDLRERVRVDKVSSPSELLDMLKGDLVERLGTADRTLTQVPGSVDVWLFVGVNGVGKTTTIGKLAQRESREGKRVVLGAGDTFRAAAAAQLELWAERAGAEIIQGQEGADPSSVVFDAVAAGKARDADLVLLDTAGRLHTKANLMEELKKIRRTIDKADGSVREVLLVIDATTGQNGLVQAAQFRDAVDITGVVLTKLDGTAKGGIVLAIQAELGIPVKLVGVGEGAADLIEFDPLEFVEALFAES